MAQGKTDIRIERRENLIRVLAQSAKALNEGREALRKAASQVIETIDQGGFLDQELLGSVQGLCEVIGKNAADFDRELSEARNDPATRSSVELLLRSMVADDKNQLRAVQFNPEDEQSYTPEAMNRIIAGLKNDAEKQRQKQERQDRIVGWFERLVIDENTDPEAAKILEVTKQVMKNITDDEIIRLCELFCQCVKEESFEKVGKGAAENDYFKKLFAISNSEFTPHVERALYFHRIQEKDPDIKRAEDIAEKYDIALPRIEQSGFFCGQLQCVTTRTPRNASGFLNDIKQNCKIVPIAEISMVVRSIVYSTEVSEELISEFYRNTKDSTASIHSAVEYLLNKGYLLKHYLENSNLRFAEGPLYAATVAGREILLQSKVQEFLKTGPVTTAIKSYKPTILSAMGFVRYSAALKLCTMLAQKATGFSFYKAGENGNFPVIKAEYKKEALYVVPAIISEGEQGAIASLLDSVAACAPEKEESKILLVSFGSKLSEEFLNGARQFARILQEKSVFCPVYCAAVEGDYAVNAREPEELYPISEMLIGQNIAAEAAAVAAETVQSAAAETSENQGAALQNTPAPCAAAPTAKNNIPREECKEVLIAEEPDTAEPPVANSGEPDVAENPQDNFSNNNLCALVQDKESKAAHWMAEGHLAEGLALLRSQTNIEHLARSPYAAVAIAFGDPLYRHYTGIQKVTEEETAREFYGSAQNLSGAAGLLYGSYWLRKYALNHSFVSNLQHSNIEECGLPKDFTKHLNTLLHEIKNSELQKEDLYLIGDKTRTDALREYAKDIIEKNRIPAVGPRVRNTFDALLGPASEIGTLLAAISEDPQKALTRGFREQCRVVCDAYGTVKKIEANIDKKWRQFKDNDSKDRSRRIPQDIYTTTVSKIKDACEVLAAWSRGEVQQTGGEKHAGDTVRALREKTEELCEELKSTVHPENNWERMGYRAMERTLQTLNKWYSCDVDGAEAMAETLYKPLEATDYIPLMRSAGTDCLLPYFPQDKYEHLPEFPWLNAKHEHITDTEDCLERHLKTLESSQRKVVTISLENAEKAKRSFEDELDRREAWEHFVFDSGCGTDIKQAILDWEAAYWDGCSNADTGSQDYRAFMRFLKEVTDDCLEAQKNRRCKELEEKYARKNIEIDKTLRSLLQEGDFPAAETYADTHDQTVSRDTEEDRAFFKFLDNCNGYAKKCAGLSGFNAPLRSVVKKLNLARSYEDKALKLAEWWPTPGRMPERNAVEVCKLLNELFNGLNGITFHSATYAKDSSPEKIKEAGLTIQRMVYPVDSRALKKGTEAADRLPIPELGTKMTAVEVACILSQKEDSSVEELGNVVRNLCGGPESERFLIILLNRALRKEDWERLAPLLKSLYDRQRFLLIDWSLLLETFSHGDKGRYLLRCAVPLHYFNPFPKSSSSPISAELFAGRKKIVLAFNNAQDGSNFLYGGRQLGKTTIFDYVAETGGDDREVIQLTILGKKGKEALQAIAAACGDTEQELDSWQKLTSRLREKVDTGPKKVFLLIDETDAFLDDLKQKFAESYDSTEDPIQMLKDLERDASGRFRFAFAGKQNVYRFTRDCKRIADWWAKSEITSIKPFVFSEAEELLDKLKVFGVSFGDKREDAMKLKLRIFNEANYFPGLIHLFCHLLLEQIRERSRSETLKQLYLITDDDVTNIISADAFRDRQRELFWISLCLEKEYQYLAYALGASSLLDEGKKIAYSAKDLYLACKKENIVSIADRSLEEIEDYLEELVELSVLQERKDESGNVTLYRFKRKMFRDFLRPENSKDDEDIICTFWEFAGK